MIIGIGNDHHGIELKNLRIREAESIVLSKIRANA